MNIPDKPVLNVLVAYPYARESVIREMTPLIKSGNLRWLLDSGAFTAHNSGKVITLDEYCRFLDRLPVKPWRYFMLDVIGDPVATWNNYQKMLSRGFNPVPIFTHGEDWQLVEEYYKYSDYIGLGGLVGAGRSLALKILFESERHLKGRKAHFLGITSDSVIKRLRPYSCDSSNASSAQRFGQLSLYKGRGQLLTVNKLDFMKKPSNEVLRLIRSYGFNPEELNKSENWRVTKNGKCLHVKITFQSAILRQLDYEKNIGTHIFHAITAEYEMTAITSAFRRVTGIKGKVLNENWKNFE